MGRESMQEEVHLGIAAEITNPPPPAPTPHANSIHSSLFVWGTWEIHTVLTKDTDRNHKLSHRGHIKQRRQL